MTRRTVNVKLRPIKLAFLVNPKDRESLLKVIEINTFLWGGIYNPIIPTYKQIPSAWKDRPFENPSARSVVAGYLDNFDPDYVVPIGECVDYDFDVGHRRKIEDVSRILASVEEDGSPDYGIGLFEVLRYFIETELKFERKHPVEICIPRFGTRFRLFFASVFGIFPENIDRIFWKNFAKVLDAKKIDCSVSNYAEFLNPQRVFLRRMTQFYITLRRRLKQCIFYLDPTQSLDIMDYWNLRAVGWDVIPIPKQFAQCDETVQLAQDFIFENYVPHHSNSEIYHRTTILKSRSISEDEYRQFSDSLDTSRIGKSSGNPKVSLGLSYPRIWNEWARGPDHVECCELEADTDEHTISPNQETIHFKTLAPEFVSFHFAGLDASRFANEIDLRLYGDKGLRAEVIPEAEVELARVINRFNFLDWRISKKGLVYLSPCRERTVELSLPHAETVFTRWFKLKGWTVELSSAGHIAKQMILQLGGIHGIEILAREGIIQLLGRMNSSSGILNELFKRVSDLQKLLKRTSFQTAEQEVDAFVKYLKEIQLQLDGDEKSMSEEFVRDEVQRIVERTGYKIEDAVDNMVERLSDAKVLQLGVEVQCPVCTRTSWYSMKGVNYELQCSSCLTRFSLPSASKNIKWAYRALGPFSLPKHAQGAYTVLLTLRFFSGFSLLEGATTPLMSFTAEKDGMKPLEADLALFFQESKFRNSKTEVIFAECKTFNSFRQKDVDKMTDLGKVFPGAILVFAKLGEYLLDEEKAILCPLVNRMRRNRKSKSSFNPILILTGKELFWKSEFSEWWKERGGMRMAVNAQEGMLELCDFTLQTNLGIESWDRWFDKQCGLEEHPRRVVHTAWTPVTNVRDNRNV
ncbi:hypothetical protein C6503_19540 [Candidatus Poribacteria bacterium]|nr:MAG: hypothetical protein C6503_19540 [Candidatus Poribacteria bacterium]